MLIGSGSRAADTIWITGPEIEVVDPQSPTPCDRALQDCQYVIKASDEVRKKLESLVEQKDKEIQHLQDNDKIIYKQPAPWLILGGVVSIFNPLIGVPLIAAGLARSL